MATIQRYKNSPSTGTSTTSNASAVKSSPATTTASTPSTSNTQTSAASSGAALIAARQAAQQSSASNPQTSTQTSAPAASATQKASNPQTSTSNAQTSAQQSAAKNTQVSTGGTSTPVSDSGFNKTLDKQVSDSGFNKTTTNPVNDSGFNKTLTQATTASSATPAPTTAEELAKVYNQVSNVGSGTPATTSGTSGADLIAKRAAAVGAQREEVPLDTSTTNTKSSNFANLLEKQLQTAADEAAASKYIQTPDGKVERSKYLSSQIGKEQETKASGGSGSSGAYKTTYQDSRGQTYDAWIINGKTYKDPDGKEEVPVGSYVTTASGDVYLKGNGNMSYLVSSASPDNHYNVTEQQANIKNFEFSTPDGYKGYIVADPVQGIYHIEDSNHHQIGYITTDGVYHSAYYDTDYDKSMSGAAKDLLEKQGYKFDGNGVVKIREGADQNMERTFLINQFSDALERGEDATDILAALGVTRDNAQPGTPIAEYFKELDDAKAAGTPLRSAGAGAGAGSGGGSGAGAGGGGAVGSGGGSGGISFGAGGSSSSIYNNYTNPGGASRVDIPESTGYVPNAPNLQPLLDAWRDQAQSAAELRTDYATSKGINDLVRAQEDAEREFRAQQEQISADEAYARDNQVLYAEARGDRGGIGAAQYDNIANTAAINRQAVREQQTKLATDTWRQIADLRAQGEFEKADAVLEIAQTYLSNLMELEQWAANYNLSAAQFEESIREWEKNFQLSVAELTGNYNGQQTLAARNADRNFALQEAGITGTYNGQPTYTAAQNERSVLASAGNALLNAGIMPSDNQLKAMGMTAEEAQSMLYAAQAAAAAGSGGGGGGGGGGASGAYAILEKAGVTTEGQAYSVLRDAGYGTTEAKTYAQYYIADLGATQTVGNYATAMAANLKDDLAMNRQSKIDEINNALISQRITDYEANWIAAQVLS